MNRRPSFRLPAAAIAALVLVAGCSIFGGRPPTPVTGVRVKVPFIRQEEGCCGAAAIVEVAQYYGRFLTQDEVAAELYSPRTGGIITLDINLYLRERGFWTASIVPAPYRTHYERKQEVAGLIARIKGFIDRGHPVIALLGPRDGAVLGFDVRVIMPIPPFIYLSDRDELMRLNHFVVLTGYDEASQTFFMHDGLNPDVTMSFSGFRERWEKIECWALAAVPPDRINWDLTASEALDAGVLCERLGRYDLALERYQEARAKAGGADAAIRTGALFNTANVYMAQERHAEAEAILAALIRDGGGTGPVLNNLAEVFRHDTGRLGDAERLVQQALAADRENAVFYLDTYAMILAQQGAYDRAREVLTRALASDLAPDVASVLNFHLGQVLLQAGDSRGGLAAITRALAQVDEEREPRRAGEYGLACAQAALAAGETVKARAELKKVLALDQGEFGWQAKELLAGMPAE